MMTQNVSQLMSEAQYEFLELLPNAILIYQRGEDGAFSKLYANEQFNNLFGIKAGEIVERATIVDAIHPEDRDSICAKIEESLTGDKKIDEIYRLVDEGKNIIWVRHISNTVFQPDGSSIIYLVLNDITAKKNEESWKKSLFERYSNYFEKRFDVNDLNSILSVMDLQSDMLKSIANMYVVMYLINLKDDTFIEIACMDHVKKLFGSIKSTKAVLKLVVDNFVAPDFRDAAREFNDMDTLAERLKGKPVISMDYDAVIAGWCRQQFIPVSWDENGLATEAICIEQRIQAEKMKVDHLRQLAETDGLTQLLNRTSGAHYISDYLQKHDKGMFCLFDVDNFKHFNDFYGHDVGDQILMAISACMKECFDGSALLMRAGGDEFGIFLLDIDDRAEGQRQIDLFGQEVEKLHFEGFEEKVSVSAGLAFSDGINHRNFDELFKTADQMMYQCKREKKRRLAQGGRQ